MNPSGRESALSSLKEAIALMMSLRRGSSVYFTNPSIAPVLRYGARSSYVITISEYYIQKDFFPFVRLHDECLSSNSDADFAPREFSLIPEFRQVRISLQSGSVRPSPVGMSHQDTHGLRLEAP